MMFPSPLDISHKFPKNKKKKIMGASKNQTEVLKILHPRRPPEIYRQPITAGEIMSKHPRYCIARPDVFQFPWIVVHPNSVLVPGKTFYLVPYTTLDKLMKQKRKQLETLLSPENNQSLKLDHHRNYLEYRKEKNSPTKALAGVTPPKRQLYDDEQFYYGQEQDSDNRAGSLYKREFYDSWNSLRRNLQKSEEGGDRAGPGLGSPLGGGGPGFTVPSRPRPRVESPEQIELLRVKSCLRKPDSERKKLNLKVKFLSAVVIPGSRKVSPDNDLALQVR